MRCIAFDRLFDSDRPVVGALACDDLEIVESAYREIGVARANGASIRALDTPAATRSLLGTNGSAENPRAPGDAHRIVWHAPIAAPSAERPVWTKDGDALWFEPPGVARYRCTADGIEVTPFAGADYAHVDALLIATALPALLWLQGDIVLHTAAVVPQGSDSALAIAGRSGSGKSHLAAALLARGGALVADDSIALGGNVCAGLAGGYHLGTRGADERPFHLAARSRRSAPLGTLIVLDDDPAPPARLTGTAALGALLANRHRASVPRLCGLEPRGLAALARLAPALRVFRASQQDADRVLGAAIRAHDQEGQR